MVQDTAAWPEAPLPLPLTPVLPTPVEPLTLLINQLLPLIEELEPELELEEELEELEEELLVTLKAQKL